MASLGDFTLPSPSLSDLLGTLNSAVSIPNTGNLPWAGTSNPGRLNVPNNQAQSAVTSTFFPYFAPDPNLWDKLVDYRIVVIDTANGNRVVGGNLIGDVEINPLGNGTLSFTPMSTAWEFFLPITPQQLSISDAYSINTSATLRGILEEHSGTRFKTINIQGTFGVWPGRPSITKPPGTPNVLQSVFGGTIAAAQNVATQFTSIINNITTGSNASKPVTIRPDTTAPSETISNANDPEYGGVGTGYFQQIMLSQFIEQYSEAKKNPANASWRLVFDIPKQKQSFVVTPVAYTWTENVNRPMEINYNIQFKAWRRINLKDNTIAVPLEVTQLTPGILQQITNTIQAAQNTAAAAVNLIGAVRSDVDGILNVIRQTGLLVKGIAGIAIAASDPPAQLVGDAQSTISNFLATVNPSNLLGTSNSNPGVGAGAQTSQQKAVTALNQIQALNATNEGLSSTAVASGQLGPSAATSATLTPSAAVFANPLQYPLLFAQVPVNSLTLNPAQQNALDTEITNVGNFTVANLKTMRATILSLCIQLGNAFGAGDAYYSTLFNQPAPTVTNQPMTLDQFDVLQSFYSLLEAYDILTATNQLDDQQILNGVEFVSALAATSDIDFAIPNSKIQVPVPFGLNIEQIAMRYLGDPQRWIEIATLNDLREPYIDENGFTLSLLSNADGRNIVVGSIEDLFIGQTVYLYSTTQVPTARAIINIEKLSQTSYNLTLDGLANLSVFTTSDQAYIQAYLPQTVNSQNVIFIPSDIQTTDFDEISVPASVANVDLVGLSKVDFLLQNQDLAITNTGDFRLAAGYTNLLQALGTKFGTTLGTSLLYPTFGFGFRVGSSNSDFDAKALYNQIVTQTTADPRFQAVTGLQVTLNGPSLGINMGVQLAGQTGVYPVGFVLGSTI
jgi:hypothetical protein